MRRLYLLAIVVGACALALVVAGTAGGKHGPKPDKGRASKGALFAQLSGRNEISPSGQRNAGDPDGRGSFTAITTSDGLCFGITVSGLSTPTAAHIHAARKHHNGAIVVPLTPPSSGDPGASSGCVTVSDAGLLAAIRKHPNRYYANVHTVDFPGGAIRGQLFHAKPGQAR